MQTINIYRSSTLGLETLTFILKTKLYAELAALESLPEIWENVNIFCLTLAH